MRRSWLLGAALLAGASPTLAAQAPRVTSSGDPSVQSDTIYRLAADPAQFPEQGYLLLLDDGIVRVEADGRSTSTYRQVVQILNADAVATFSERVYGWSPEREKFRLNWIRVVRPDGSVISEGPAQRQEADVPVAMGDPVYSARKQLRISLSGVAPGTLVDYSFTTEQTRVWIPGDFYDSWSIHTGVPVKRSRYILDTPVGMAVNLRERNLTFQPTRVVRGGRQVTTWAAADLPVIKGQSFATDSGPKYMSLAMTGPVTWEAIGNWYAGLARDRYTVTPAVTTVLAPKLALAGARTLIDSVLVLHKWVTQDIRYVSIALGIGGYRPRSPDEVARTGFGDCKDKATIFVAVLRQWGVPASTVLLSSEGGVDTLLPSISQFDHAIARVDLGDRQVFTDLTAGSIPFGQIPLAIEGSFGLLVEPAGRVERVRFPTSAVTANVFRTELVGAIDTAGRITGSMTVTAKGWRGTGFRNNYQTTLDSTTRTTAARRIAQSMFEGARGDTLLTFDGKDLTILPLVHLAFSNGKALQRSGTGWILPNPLGTMSEQEGQITEVEKEIERDGGRWQPISVASVTGPSVTEIEVRFTLPEGWKVAVPPSVHTEGVFGTYDAQYRQDGREFIATRRIEGRSGAIAPSRVNELLDYLRILATDNTPYLSIETPGRR